MSSPRRNALEILDAYQVQKTPTVSYLCKGNLLLIGPKSKLLRAIEILPASLDARALVTTECFDLLSNTGRIADVPAVTSASLIEVEGYLGNFYVSALIDGRRVRVDSLFPHQAKRFDLIVDLQTVPSINRDVLPIGYFSLAAETSQIKQVFADCCKLIGQFDKPVFFAYNKLICAHDRSGISGCRKCIEVCPAEAITPQHQQIQVNSFLCQGCGDCTTICPAGAINYQYPPRIDTLNRIRRLIKSYREEASYPILLFHSEIDQKWIDSRQDSLPETLLPYSIESLSSVGIEIWLAALAYGAAQVKLLTCDSLSDSSKILLSSQLRIARELLAGVGMDPTCIQWTTKDGVCSRLFHMPQTQTSAAANFAGIEDKRTVIRLALEHLRERTKVIKEAIPLSQGAPFGELEINTDACTLCMACVSLCPEGALDDGFDLPQLKFVEANCVQCGLCQNACPEHAITMRPRFLSDPVQARTPRILHEEPVVHCIQCGKAFATESMIATISNKLRNHPMFQGVNQKRLKMCEDCKINSMFGA